MGDCHLHDLTCCQCRHEFVSRYYCYCFNPHKVLTNSVYCDNCLREGGKEEYEDKWE